LSNSIIFIRSPKAETFSPLTLDNRINLLTFHLTIACDRDLEIHLFSETNPRIPLAQKMLRYWVQVSDGITRAFFQKGA
jgi:hypothetical protein